MTRKTKTSPGGKSGPAFKTETTHRSVSQLPAPTPELMAHFSSRLSELNTCLGCSRSFGRAVRPDILVEFYPNDFFPHRVLYTLCRRCQKLAKRKDERGAWFRREIERPILAELAARAATLATAGGVQ